jgi:hypothetical protein
MKISQVLPLVDDITHLGPVSKEAIVKALTVVQDKLDDYNLIDDMADIYMNVTIVQDKILEEFKDAELYMNIVFDIPVVATYLNSTVTISEEEQYSDAIADISYEVSKVRYLTYFNLFLTSVNALLFYLI